MRNNTRKVACKPFGTMLHGAGLASGDDIASIDVEGAELQVLAPPWTGASRSAFG